MKVIRMIGLILGVVMSIIGFTGAQYMSWSEPNLTGRALFLAHPWEYGSFLAFTIIGVLIFGICCAPRGK